MAEGGDDSCNSDSQYAQHGLAASLQQSRSLHDNIVLYSVAQRSWLLVCSILCQGRHKDKSDAIGIIMPSLAFCAERRETLASLTERGVLNGQSPFCTCVSTPPYKQGLLLTLLLLLIILTLLYDPFAL